MAVDKFNGRYNAHCEIAGCDWNEDHTNESDAVKALNQHYINNHIKRMVEETHGE